MVNPVVKMRPPWPSSGTSQLASYKEVRPPPPGIGELFVNAKVPPLSSIAIQSRIFVNSPRQSLGRYAGFTKSIDSADTVMMM